MKPKLEFSKLILIILYITSVLFTVFAGYLALHGVDISTFAPVVLAVWVELGTSTGFYYWKAKSENRIKLLMSVPDNLSDEASQLLDKE